MISILRGSGHDVSTVFDPKGFKAWESSTPTSELDDNIVDTIIKTGCQALFAYTTTVHFQRLVNIFDLVKERAPNITIAVGGPHATYAHEHTIRKKSIDYLCRGEGEIAILQILELIDRTRTELPVGVYRMNRDLIEGKGFGSLVNDLDDLPYPDKSDFYENVPNVRDVYTTATGRGCYNSCTFCNSPTMRTHYRDEGYQFLRRRSVDDVVSELALAKKIYNPRLIFFVDDTFIYNKRYMSEFAKQYKDKVGIPFRCSTIPNFFHEEVIDDLVDAGLFAVDVGVQSLNPDTRLAIFGRKESNDQYTAFISMLKRRGVYTVTDHIINPWDTRENLKQQLLQYSVTRPSWINVFHLQYFPDTKVIEEAIRDGHLDPEAVEGIGEGNINSYFRGGDIQDIMESLHDLIVLLPFVPILPAWLTKLIVNTRLLVLFKIMPSQLVLVLRAINAMIRGGDEPGRLYLKILFQSIFKIQVRAAKHQLKTIKEMAKSKPVRLLSPQVALRQVNTNNMPINSSGTRSASI